MLLDYRNRSMHCSLIIPYSSVSSRAKQLNILFSVGDSISISSYSLKDKICLVQDLTAAKRSFNCDQTALSQYHSKKQSTVAKNYKSL